MLEDNNKGCFTTTSFFTIVQRKPVVNFGDQVICLDNCSSGNKSNIKDLITNSNFEFIRHDVINPITIEVDQFSYENCMVSLFIPTEHEMYIIEFE